MSVKLPSAGGGSRHLAAKRLIHHTCAVKMSRNCQVNSDIYQYVFREYKENTIPDIKCQNDMQYT